MENNFDVIVIGGGPAGLTAGIYLSRAKLSTLILNEGAAGGQMVLTHEVANYPGIESISGYQLSRNMRKQAEKFGGKVKSNIKVTNLNLSDDIKSVEINNNETFFAKSIILATGGKSRTIGAKGEDIFKGKGISYCATCDGDFFQDKNIIVVGGGNSALEEAVSLTKYANSVTVVHQFDHFQAFESAVHEAKSNSKINFIMESEIQEFIGKDKLEKVIIKNMRTGEFSSKEIDGVFILIGYVPNTESLMGIIEVNNRNEIITNDLMETNIPGVFAAGDSRAKRFRQITTSVSDGTIAALSAAEYVEKHKEVLA
ncbi:MAG: thioredoxin-disulfide reductase [Ignavibacteriae bacterium]|nr:thioredoxin-disulfide reductase [Ignavibacteriota bacterium]